MSVTTEPQEIATALADTLVSLIRAVVTAHPRDSETHAHPVPTSQPDPVYWTVEQVAEVTQYSPTLIRQWARAGRIPARKLDQAWRFIPAEVRAWAASQPDNQS